MSAILPAALRVRLVKICARMGSEHDGERAAAALLASRLLHTAGLSWEDVIASERSPSSAALQEMMRQATARPAAHRPAPPRPHQPSQVYRHPDDDSRAQRFQTELRFVRDHLQLLTESEQRQFLGRDSAPWGWDENHPTRQDMFWLDLLAGIIRRRMEGAAA